MLRNLSAEKIPGAIAACGEDVMQTVQSVNTTQLIHSFILKRTADDAQRDEIFGR